MGFSDILYKGTPRGIDKNAALIILIINIVAPGVGTIISAFLSSAECQNDTVFIGIAQAITTPLLGLGFFWAIAWSIHLYKSIGVPAEDAENPLVSDTPS